MSAEEAEAETRHQFAVRANSILAFIECDEEQRPKLRKAIIEAMLWAQTQPKLPASGFAEREAAHATSARAIAPAAFRASWGASSTCRPRWPPLRNTLAWPSAACSIATGTRFFCPNGEMPPTW